METEKKRSISLVIFIGIIILAAAALFIWGRFLNKGTLEITAAAPFEVEIYGGERITCSASPCEIKDKSGRKDLIITKDGHRTVLTEAEVKAFRSTELTVELELIPYIEETDTVPEFDDQIAYEIVLDEATNNQKLIASSDTNQRAIVFFEDEIQPRKIIGSQNTVLIHEESGNAYVIDVNNSGRNKIIGPELNDLIDGKWSSNGKYLVFSKESTDKLWLMYEDSYRELLLKTGIPQVSWTTTNNLLFVTDQGVQSEIRLGSYESYITLLEDKAFQGLTFGEYHPAEDSYTKIESFSELQRLPQNLIPTSNGSTIYFQLGRKVYKIILGKF